MSALLFDLCTFLPLMAFSVAVSLRDLIRDSIKARGSR